MGVLDLRKQVATTYARLVCSFVQICASDLKSELMQTRLNEE